MIRFVHQKCFCSADRLMKKDFVGQKSQQFFYENCCVCFQPKNVITNQLTEKKLNRCMIPFIFLIKKGLLCPVQTKQTMTSSFFV